MTTPTYEYELKFLAKNKSALDRFFSYVYTHHTNLGEETNSMEYFFQTVYHDEADRRFRKSGFSLRSRQGVNGFKPSVELKSLTGTRRIELTERGGCTLAAYFNLMARPDYPIEAPRPAKFISEMDEVMVIGAKRSSMETIFEPLNLDVEMCYDEIFYNSQTVFPDEYEVELEFKNITDEQFDQVIAFFEKEIEPRFPDVHRTTLSKAQRGYDRYELVA